MEKQLTGQHVHVGAVRDAEDVGWHFVTPLADVHLDHTVGVDGVPLVRVDGHAEETRVSLQRFGCTKHPRVSINSHRIIFDSKYPALIISSPKHPIVYIINIPKK